MNLRGASESDVIETVRSGAGTAAKLGRSAFSKNLDYDGLWMGRTYQTKQVLVDCGARRTRVHRSHRVCVLLLRSLMKITYDPQVDALYIRLVDEPAQVTTKRLSDDVAIDYGPRGSVVGIEVLDAASNGFFSRTERKVLLENLTAVAS
jgi:uncharacterized protein YuzE